LPLETPAGYVPLDSASIPAFLSGLPKIAARLGGRPVDWQVSEVGDGNLNLVFLVRGPADGICIKQALPYVRLVGESWPMPLERAFFEHECLQEHGRHVGELLPRVYHYEPALYAIVMELLEPHVIMRRGMIRGIRYPRFAADIARYLAGSLSSPPTSRSALPPRSARWRVSAATRSFARSRRISSSPILTRSMSATGGRGRSSTALPRRFARTPNSSSRCRVSR
jgi:5-methylthioribose kinase